MPTVCLVIRHRASIYQAFGFQFKMWQDPVIHTFDVEAQSFVRAGQVFRELMLEFFFTPDIDLELIDGRVFADNGFNCTWVDVGAADKFHIVPATPDATAVD